MRVTAAIFGKGSGKEKQRVSETEEEREQVRAIQTKRDAEPQTQPTKATRAMREDARVTQRGRECAIPDTAVAGSHVFCHGVRVFF